MCEFVRESREYDVVKWALSGTTLADINEKSYVSRLNQEIDAQEVPIMFYTGTFMDSELYQSMVDSLIEISEKWNFKIIRI